MTKRAVATDVALVGVAGLGAAKLMGVATTFMYEHQSDEAKTREEAASYGVAYNVAAQKIAGFAGRQLSEDQESKTGLAIHYALALGWVPIYMVLNRRVGISAPMAGAAAGLSMSLLVDELANPLLGFTPPPQAYPLVTHLRGLAGHLVYGLSVAALVEAGWTVTCRRRRR